MKIFEKENGIRWILIIISFVFVIFILLHTYSIFQNLKDEEHLKMELWAKAQKSLMNAGLDSEVELQIFIKENNKNIPLILTDAKGSIISTFNIGEAENDSIKLKGLLKEMKGQNSPIKIEYAPNEYNIVYYGNSTLLNGLKFYPLSLFLILILFLTLIYNYYRANKMATQNKLWAGMAKETAHQIGTPLSSLIGWLELLKLEDIDATTFEEIEKDISRLQTITDRFSKIGSEPITEEKDIVEETRNSFEYLQLRSSKQVEFEFNAPKKPIMAKINPILHSWAIENLVKNAVDAMKGKGKLAVEITEGEKQIYITVTDTGCGIPKNKFKKIFEPGYTSKKRGWGLGLSLTKRIVNDYHKGKIRVVHSEIGKGTTIQMMFLKALS
ncbi:MAG: HAMP domain-containing sensor histidine kinase [Flavobacterium sp.]